MRALVMTSRQPMYPNKGRGRALGTPAFTNADGVVVYIERGEPLLLVERERSIVRWTAVRVIDKGLKLGWVWFSTDELDEQTT